MGTVLAKAFDLSAMVAAAGASRGVSLYDMSSGAVNAVQPSTDAFVNGTVLPAAGWGFPMPGILRFPTDSVLGRTVGSPSPLPFVRGSSFRCVPAPYYEPTDKELIDEISLEIAITKGGEVRDGEMEAILKDIFSDIAKAAGVDAEKYTLHILGEGVPNMYASPGNHIWVTGGALRNHSFRSGMRKAETFFGDAETIPLGLAHELSHQQNGDTELLLRKYRSRRREAITGLGKDTASWSQVISEALPGGRSYRQELKADKFSAELVEAAGYSTRNALTEQLTEGQSSFETSHPSWETRGWRDGLASTRVPRERAAKDADRNLRRIDAWRAKDTGKYRIKVLKYKPAQSDPWTILNKASQYYYSVLNVERRSAVDPLGIEEEYQRALLAVLRGCDDFDTFLRAYQWILHSVYVMHEFKAKEKRPVVRGLNRRTKYTDEIDRLLNGFMKKIDPGFVGDVSFSSIDVKPQWGGGSYKPGDVIDDPIINRIGRTINSYVKRQYDSGEIGFTDYVAYFLRTSRCVCDDTKRLLHDMLAAAKTPEELAEGYYLVYRLGFHRWWEFGGDLDPVKMKKAIRVWWYEGPAHILSQKTSWGDGRFTFTSQGILEGEHIIIMREKGWIPKGATLEEAVKIVLDTFARDGLPLYRTACEWPIGDLVGLARLYPEMLGRKVPKKFAKISMAAGGHAAAPLSTAEVEYLLDSAGADHFRAERKPRFRMKKEPFRETLHLVVQAAELMSEWSYNSPMNFSEGIDHIVSGNDPPEFSEELANEYAGVSPGSAKEERLLAAMIAELDEARARFGEGVRRSFAIERHFLGSHRYKNFRKRARLIEAVLAGAPPRDGLKTFSDTGSYRKPYRADIQDSHFLPPLGPGLYHPGCENNYAALLEPLATWTKGKADVRYALDNFDFEKAPWIKYALEVKFYTMNPSDPLNDAKSLDEFLRMTDGFFSRDNPFRWVVFNDAWERFGADLNGVSLGSILAALPDLNYFKSGKQNIMNRKNAAMIHNFFEASGHNDAWHSLCRPYNVNSEMRVDVSGRLPTTAQSIEREIYESAVRNGLISLVPRERMNQVEGIFKSTSGSGTVHPFLDRERWTFMQTLDEGSEEWGRIRKKLKDPEVKTLAAMRPFEAELRAAGSVSHEEQRNIIRKHLPVGSERDRFLDAHLKRAKGLTAEDIRRYGKLYSDHPKSEFVSGVAFSSDTLGKVRELKAVDKQKLVMFFISHGDRGYLKDLREDDLMTILKSANFIFERNRDDQIAFFYNLFMGETSMLDGGPVEGMLVEFLLLADEEGRTGVTDVVTEFLRSLYFDGMDLWDRGQLLAELIVDSQRDQRTRDLTPPVRTPDRIVRIMRLIRGFGPKAAQILRSHKAILGLSSRADEYRKAFGEFEERAQRVDLVEALKSIERAFGGNFHEYFRSIDGILGAGSVKKILLATLVDGRQVAIKYIDADYERRIDHSLETLKKTVRSMEAKRGSFPELPLLESILDAIEKDIRKEEDLKAEHAAYRALRERAARTDAGEGVVVFPLTHEELGLPATDGSVVVEEAFEVVSIDDEEAMARRGFSRAQFAELHLREQLRELIAHGAFDYDARPANWTAMQDGEGRLNLGYFDKAQTVFLTDVERQALLSMMFAMTTSDVSAFTDAYVKFETGIEGEISKALMNEFVEAALGASDGNPYIVLQELVSALENAGVAMSASKTLKLSMFLRQIDRYIQMTEAFDVRAAIFEMALQ